MTYQEALETLKTVPLATLAEALQTCRPPDGLRGKISQSDMTQELARRATTLLAFVGQVARLSPYDEDEPARDPFCAKGQDAKETVNSLITLARRLTA